MLSGTALIRFQDCDPFQHLNNSKYLDYFLNSREDQLLSFYNLDVYQLAREEKIGWVVGQSQISYLKPAFYMEKVNIETQLIKFSERSVTVEMRMTNIGKTVLNSILWSTFVHVDLKDGNVKQHSSKLMELFENVLLPVEEEIFEIRAGKLRKSTK
ncbi:MAG: acyl-CoA thioesterase [Opitutaceae bacterium]|nr:acyl-CoA thioesterase [Cytophagales bacterium]